jgi:ParB/RepB/Spo0J family partition protein
MTSIALKDIWIDRGSRQRKEIIVDDLLESIPLRGVLVPIIVTSEQGPAGQPYKLLAGERRFTASRKLNLPDIPARLLADLDPIEQKLVELEENLRRKDLGWQDQCLAIANIHDILSQKGGEEWGYAKTAASIGYGQAWVQRCCRIAKELHRDNIRTLETATRAYNFISREDERVAADAVSNILSTATEAAADAFNGEGGTNPLDDLLTDAPDLPTAPNGPPKSARSAPLIIPPETSILQQSFLDWAPAYRGEPFNLIHCDFPYGVNVFGGKWSGKQTTSGYKDTVDVYEQLITTLCTNLDTLMAHSGHLVFWLSGDITIQHRTLQMFSDLAPDLAFCKFPLIWVKSDNVGIVPDPKREPRRIYEAALIASREDRLLVKPVSNAISAQTNKEFHPHTKPEPVLKHFLQMFVDNNTRMLDPTCGGGSSLRAAEALGAAHVLGLEINDEYVGNARRALQQFRILRKASSIQKEQSAEGAQKEQTNEQDTTTDS